MKQTAIEWLVEELGIIDIKDPYYYEIFNKAKQIEKEQIMNAFDDGKSDGYKTAREWDELIIFSDSEQYYHETYKTNEQ